MGLYTFDLCGERFSICDQSTIVDSDFYTSSMRFFDKAIGKTTLHDNFFSILAGFINRYASVGLWHLSEQLWNQVIQLALDWEKQHPGRYIHKGTPYYFWGSAAISRGELDMGYPLMHQALQEDIRTHQNAKPSTPAFWLVTLDYMQLEQAFRVWPLTQSRFLETFLEKYNATYRKNLLLDDFRTKFLINNPDLDLVFLFAYTLGRHLLFNRVPHYARENQITCQIEMNLLFDLALVIDAAIKLKNPNKKYFSWHVLFLSDQAGLGLTQNQIQEQASRAYDGNFSQTLQRILDNIFQFNDQSKASGLSADLLVSYGARNFGAHNVSANPIVRQRYLDIQQSLFNVLFLATETLY